MSAKWCAIGFLAALLITGCTTGENATLVPAADRPTFLFFFTDN